MKLPKIPHFSILVGPTVSYYFGIALNAIVMAANHSQMPVNLPNGLEIPGFDAIHTTMVATTHLKWLADWIVIDGSGIASPGDIFLWAGQALMIPLLFAWVALVSKENQ